MILYRSIRLRMKKNISGKSRKKNRNTFYGQLHFINIVPFMIQCGKKFVQLDRPRMTTWCVRIPCWITKATNTHSEYIILKLFQYTNCCKYAPQCYVIVHCPILVTSQYNAQYLLRHSIMPNTCYVTV